MKNNISQNIYDKLPPSPRGRGGQGGEGKLALIHDHLAQDGGAEKVLQALAGLYPQAPIYTLLYRPEYYRAYFSDRILNASFIQNFPLGIAKYQWYIPFMPAAIESFDLRNYDLVLSSASSFAKGIIAAPQTTHICYCHTTTRYLWDYSQQYLEELPLNKFFKKIINMELSRLRQWDKAAAERVDFFIANSKNTQQRIKKYYGRDSIVIYPPVDTDRFNISEEKKDYFITGGRLTPYKRFDIAIKAFNKLNLPLKIFGEGPDKKRLQKMAMNNIEFLGKINESDKQKYLAEAQAFIHPQEEDFGIAAIEAQASGTPVIAYNKGGATETILHERTGLLFNQQSWEELADAVLRFNLHYSFDPRLVKENAERFRVDRFNNEIVKYITEITNNKEC